VALADLVRFFQHPAKALLRARAGLYVGGDDELPGEQIPTALDPLQSWAIGDRMLSRRLAGAELVDLVAAEWRRGELPPQALGSRTIAPVAGTVADLDTASAGFRAEVAATLDLDARVGPTTVTGTAGPLYGDRWVTVSYSRLAAKHRLAGWLQLLTLAVTAPERPWQVVTIGKAGRSVLGPVSVEVARETLADLLELYTLGQHELLPLPVGCAAEYARIRARSWPVEQARAAMAKPWERDDDEAWQLLLDPPATLDGLLATPARAAEQRGPVAEPSRFGMLAVRVWSRLLWLEELS
jgi:exodeoxyribonuclease V gamma subunit